MTRRATLTRRVTFSAAHRYHRPAWDAARNAAAFGACGQWHGHTYQCDVTVGGAIDAETGFCADLVRLDDVLRTEVFETLDHRNLVTDVPEFADGRAIPSSENVAWWIADRVQGALGATTRVLRVRVSEAPGLWAEVEPG